MFVQKSLKTLKFLNPSATADGIYGGQTRTAVEAFQEKQGLPRTGKVDAVTYERLCTQVKLALAERPDLSSGTPDGLRKMDDPPKGRTPYASGTLAAGVGAATVALGVTAEGKDATTPTEPAAQPGARVAKPVEAPTTVVVPTPKPTKTSASVGVPTETGQLSTPSSWSDPLLALSISVGFVLTVVLAAWFFRKTTHM